MINRMINSQSLINFLEYWLICDELGDDGSSNRRSISSSRYSGHGA